MSSPVVAARGSRVSHAPGVIDEGARLASRLTRHRGGTYSPTVGRATLIDGSTVLADLIRLTPNIDAYSLDHWGESPRDTGHYRIADWGDAPNPALARLEAEIVWILRNSYPTLDPATVTAELRAAGVSAGAGDIPIHEAIAATQAAIWHYTDGLRLERGATTDLVRAGSDGGRWPSAVTRRQSIGPGEPAVFTARLVGEPCVSGYSIRFAADPPHGVHAVLQQSMDGRAWADVPSSRARVVDAVPDGSGVRLEKGLVAGATTSRSRHGHQLGYGHYRVVLSVAGGRAEIDPVSIELDVADARANSARMLALYDHLVAGARRARAGSRLIHGPSHILHPPGELVGPFRVDSQRVGRARVSAVDSSGRVVALVDERGRAVTVVEGGQAVSLAPEAAGSDRATIRIDVESGWDFRGRLLLGRAPSHGRALTTLGLVERVPAAGARAEHVVRWRSRSQHAAAVGSAH